MVFPKSMVVELIKETDAATQERSRASLNEKVEDIRKQIAGINAHLDRIDRQLNETKDRVQQLRAAARRAVTYSPDQQVPTPGSGLAASRSERSRVLSRQADEEEAKIEKLQEDRNRYQKQLDDLSKRESALTDRVDTSSPVKKEDEAPTVDSKAEAERLFSLGETEKQHENLRAAFSYYKQAADNGHSKAMYYLADMHLKGLGTEQDVKAAVIWYKKAADNGVAGGALNLGHLHRLGIGVDKDPQKSAEWFRRAAELGDLDGAACYGMACLSGTGVSKNEADAFKWIKVAAEGKILAIMPVLAMMYREGIGTAKDETKSLHWRRRSALIVADNFLSEVESAVQDGKAIIPEDKLRGWRLIHARSSAALESFDDFVQADLDGGQDDARFQSILISAKQIVASANLAVESILLNRQAILSNDEARAAVANRTFNTAVEGMARAFKSIDTELPQLAEAWGLPLP